MPLSSHAYHETRNSDYKTNYGQNPSNIKKYGGRGRRYFRSGFRQEELSKKNENER